MVTKECSFDGLFGLGEAVLSRCVRVLLLPYISGHIAQNDQARGAQDPANSAEAVSFEIRRVSRSIGRQETGHTGPITIDLGYTL